MWKRVRQWLFGDWGEMERVRRACLIELASHIGDDDDKSGRR
jgi:hypothetical protein